MTAISPTPLLFPTPQYCLSLDKERSPTLDSRRQCFDRTESQVGATVLYLHSLFLIIIIECLAHSAVVQKDTTADELPVRSHSRSQSGFLLSTVLKKTLQSKHRPSTSLWLERTGSSVNRPSSSRALKREAASLPHTVLRILFLIPGLISEPLIALTTWVLGGHRCGRCEAVRLSVRLSVRPCALSCAYTARGLERHRLSLLPSVTQMPPGAVVQDCVLMAH